MRNRHRAPRVGDRGAPLSALLPRQRAAHHPPHVLAPVLLIQHRQQRAIGIHVRRNHQPPQRIAALVGKSHHRALEIEPAAQQVECFLETFVASRNILHALEYANPVDQRRGRPQRRIDGNRVEHRGLGAVVPRQRLDRGKLTHRQVGRRQRTAAHDAAGRVRLQPGQHAIERFFRPFTAGGVGNLHQIRRECVAALQPVGRKIARQPVVVEIVRYARGHRLPQTVVAEPDCFRSALLEAGVGIAHEILTHRRHLTRERAHHVDTDPATAGHRAGRTFDRNFERLVELREGRLIYTHRVHFDHFLRDAQLVARAGRACGGDFPVQALDIDRHFHRHQHKLGFARRKRHALIAARQRLGLPVIGKPVAQRPCELRGERLGSGVSQRKHAGKFVLLAHHRRQA